MPHFKKKPVVIEAVQFDGSNFDEVYAFGNPIGGTLTAKVLFSDDPPTPGVTTLTIETLEGNMTAQPGDWIIRGVKGELYPCKPDIFATTYEPACDPRCEFDSPGHTGPCAWGK